ncbi:hypothetical protein DV737_g4851, partial [Chaetothyriales sp. CBS 132003]
MQRPSRPYAQVARRNAKPATRPNLAKAEGVLHKPIAPLPQSASPEPETELPSLLPRADQSAVPTVEPSTPAFQKAAGRRFGPWRPTTSSQAVRPERTPPPIILHHQARPSLLGGQPTPSYHPLAGGAAQNDLYSAYSANDHVAAKGRRSFTMYSKWAWAFLLTTVVQALIVLAFESYVFGRFQSQLHRGSAGLTQARTITTFLTLYIFGFVYQLVLVWDALRLKNTLQVFGLVLYNVGLLIYGAVQLGQIHDAVNFLSSAGQIDADVWNEVKPYLVAIPCVLGLGTIIMALGAWKLYDEFAWTIYKHISADLRMKRRYLAFQVYIALLKFDFFFFLGFTVQFVVIVTHRGVEFALTIAAIPVTILILLSAAYFCRNEIMWGTIGVILLYLGGLTYFIFKLVRIKVSSIQDKLTTAGRPATASQSNYAAYANSMDVGYAQPMRPVQRMEID